MVKKENYSVVFVILSLILLQKTLTKKKQQKNFLATSN